MRVLCDVHTHTIFSRHAYSTIEENVRAAAACGCELLGSTDHFSDMLFETQSMKNFQHFINTPVWPREWHGVTLLRGCEIDIVDTQGRLFADDIVLKSLITGASFRERTLQEDVLSSCDYAIASLHRSDFIAHNTPVQNTEMYIKALEHPKVLILGHIGRSGADLDIDALVEAARDMHKLIEINACTLLSSRRTRAHERCRTLAERCAELGCSISVGSDAHISTEIGQLDAVTNLLEEIHFPEELIACSSRDRFLGALESAGLSLVG